MTEPIQSTSDDGCLMTDDEDEEAEVTTEVCSLQSEV